EHRLSRCFKSFEPCVKLREVNGTTGEEPWVPDDHLATTDTGNHALAGQCLERVHVRWRDAALESCLDHRLSEWMFGGGFGCGCEGEKFMLAAATDRFDLAHEGAPLGQRAGLIEHDLFDESEALEGFAGPHQDAPLRGLSFGMASPDARAASRGSSGVAHQGPR